MMKACASGHQAGRVVPLGQQHQGMVGAAVQQWTIDQRAEPGQDGFQKAADQILDKRRHIRQIARAAP